MMTDVMGRERYRLDRPLGIGAMGTVHLARDTVLDRVVAVKVLAEHLATDEMFRHRFVREARLAARLIHPNIVSVFDAGDDDGRPYLVMEYVDGETVADRLAGDRKLTAEELVGLLIELSAGLAYAHEQGIVHRDVKPHNVLLRSDGVAKLTDFGIARAIADEGGLTEVGSVLGTAAFMAPEQAAGEAVGPAADVYSLAALARHAAAGPLPPYLEALVTAALDPDPAARPSAKELHCHLSGWGDTDHPAASDTAPTEVRPSGATQVLPAPLHEDPLPEAGPTRRFIAAGVTAVVCLLFLLAVVSGVGSNAGSSEGTPESGPATSTTAPAAPDPADPAQTARDFATWLRSQTD